MGEDSIDFIWSCSVSWKSYETNTSENIRFKHEFNAHSWTRPWMRMRAPAAVTKYLTTSTYGNNSIEVCFCSFDFNKMKSNISFSMEKFFDFILFYELLIFVFVLSFSLISSHCIHAWMEMIECFIDGICFKFSYKIYYENDRLTVNIQLTDKLRTSRMPNK